MVRTGKIPSQLTATLKNISLPSHDLCLWRNNSIHRQTFTKRKLLQLCKLTHCITVTCELEHWTFWKKYVDYTWISKIGKSEKCEHLLTVTSNDNRLADLKQFWETVSKNRCKPEISHQPLILTGTRMICEFLFEKFSVKQSFFL